jgi:outer membrane protein
LGWSNFKGKKENGTLRDAFNFKNLGCLVVAVFGVGLCLILTGCRTKEKVAYVDNAVLMEKAVIFTSIQDSLKAFDSGWRKQAEVLKDSVNAYMQHMGKHGERLSESETRKYQEEFQARQAALARFVDANQKKAQELRASLMEPAFKKANAYFQSYLEKEGFDIILGTTSGGNILAAKKGLNITEDVVRGMNGSLQ